MKRKVTVIGNGVLSFSVAAQVSRGGAETVYVDVSKEDVSESDDYTIKVIGAEEYNTVLKKITKGYDSVGESDIVIIAITASYHQRVLQSIALLKHL